jgi:hypothetical protein
MKRALVLVFLLVLISGSILLMSRIYGAPEPVPAHEIDSMTSFVEVSNINSRKNVRGKWIISGALKNTHGSEPVNRIRIRFYFSDGMEEKNIDAELLANADELVIFTKKFSDHEDGEFERLEIEEAH